LILLYFIDKKKYNLSDQLDELSQVIKQSNTEDCYIFIFFS